MSGCLPEDLRSAGRYVGGQWEKLRRCPTLVGFLWAECPFYKTNPIFLGALGEPRRP